MTPCTAPELDSGFGVDALGSIGDGGGSGGGGDALGGTGGGEGRELDGGCGRLLRQGWRPSPLLLPLSLLLRHGWRV